MMVNRTHVVVTHQLSIIQKVDSIVVINNGKVVKHGSHNGLICFVYFIMYGMMVVALTPGIKLPPSSCHSSLVFEICSLVFSS
ncbi:hypothetical protein GQ457_10G001530 [Hibiscus cannabinus]